MGDHTDTSAGLAMPMALPLGITLSVEVTNGPTQWTSNSSAQPAFDADVAEPGTVEGPSAYPAGAAWVLRQIGFGAMPNLKGVATSTLPVGSGLSSSAALTVAFLMAWNAVAGLALAPMEIVHLARRVENEFVGLPCGLLDPWAIVFGESGRVLICDFDSVQTRSVLWPDELSVVIGHTGRSRELSAGGPYSQRVEEVRLAARQLGIGSLREANLEAIESIREPQIQARARHVVSENLRVEALATALTERDARQIGMLLRQSHASLRDDFEASSPELDAMVAACSESAGCLGARMTGAGWGGACVAIVQKSLVSSFLHQAKASYRDRTELEARFWVVEPSAGARQIG